MQVDRTTSGQYFGTEASQSQIKRTGEETQGFDRALMGNKPKELPSFVSKVYTKEELLGAVDKEVKSNQYKKKSTYDLFKDSCMEGTRAKFRFAGEEKTYGFDEFVKEFEKRSNKDR